MKMSEQEGNTNQVKGKTLQIEEMLLESSYVPTLIEKVRFKTDIGDVTWKPSKREIMMIEADGFHIKRQRDRGLYILELPKMVYDIRDALKRYESVTVKTDYTEWQKSPDHVYNFLTNEQFECMKIMELEKYSKPKRGETDDE